MNRFKAGFGLLAVMALAGCTSEKGKTPADSSASAQTNDHGGLTGAGATFPYPIYSRWFSDYAAKTGVKINYQSIGSGGGIRQLSEGTVDFGASDAPMNDTELAGAKGGPILHFPTVMVALVFTYNIPGLAPDRRLPPSTLTEIFPGRYMNRNE